MSEEKTIYCGNGQKKGDTWMKASICLDKIPAEHTFEYQERKGDGKIKGKCRSHRK
jgi:hypothetical protein